MRLGRALFVLLLAFGGCGSDTGGCPQAQPGAVRCTDTTLACKYGQVTCVCTAPDLLWICS